MPKDLNKTIFLDLDGVLATEREFLRNRKKFHEKHPLAKELNIPYPFNPGCVKILNEIIEETNCELVLTSDWRLHWNFDDIYKIFEFNGVNKNPINKTDFSPIGGFLELEKNRINEINNFIQKYDINHYVIVDDLDMDKHEIERFVKTKGNEGLKQIGIKKKIINFLNT